MADKQLAKKGKAGVDNTFRRTWDKEDFAQRAAKREKEVSASLVTLARLQLEHSDLLQPTINMTTVGEGY